MNGSGKRVTSGQRMVSAAALHDVARLSQHEAMVWADALALVVEDGQEDAPRILLARVVDELTAERIRSALLGRMGRRDQVLAEKVEELYRAATDVPADELPEWAEVGIRTPDGQVVFSGHTLDLDGRGGGGGGGGGGPVAVAFDHGHGSPGRWVIGGCAVGGRPRRSAVPPAQPTGAPGRRVAHAGGRAGRLARQWYVNGREEADFLRSLGQRVRGLREVRGLSQHQAAELAGMSKSMVSKIERGKRTGYNLLFLWSLTRAMGVPWTELADDAVRDLVRWSRVHPSRPVSAAGGARPYCGLASRRR